MENCQRGTLSRRLLAVLSMTTILALIMVGTAAAQTIPQGSANQGSPAPDCAVVTSMPGFPVVKAGSLIEPELTLQNEGIVIRQSSIKDGKIIIPPFGIYYTVRTSSWRWPLVNYPVLLMGKTYYLADVRHNFVKKTDFVVKKGERVPYGLGLSSLELSSIGTSWGPTSMNQDASFQVLKPSGNYYGASWDVSTGSPFARSTVDALTGKPGEGQTWFQADSLASTGTGYLIAKEVGPQSATVAEWVVNEITAVDIAPIAISKTLALNETMDLGKYKVKVTALDSAAKTAKVAIMDGDKVAAEQTLGPVTDKLVSLFPSVDTDLDTLMLKHENVQVGLPAYATPFKTAGKVLLVGYADVIKMKVTEPFPLDPKFVMFFDT